MGTNEIIVLVSDGLAIIISSAGCDMVRYFYRCK